jgi:hypothetical protein
MGLAADEGEHGGEGLMHPLHEDIARLLGERLKARGIVVWYDPHAEFAQFVDELRGTPAAGAALSQVVVGGSPASLVQFAGSMFELRAFVEPLVSGDTPDRVVVYLPGLERDEHGSVLMEMEKAGDCWPPRLKTIARNLLRKRYTDGQIDELLGRSSVDYGDIASALSDAGGEGPSVLKAIFSEASGSDAILGTWLVRDDRDTEILAKEAIPELLKLIRSRLGLELPEATSVAKLRAIAIRYVLAGEFRSDLTGDPPASLEGVPSPRRAQDVAAVRDLARRLRLAFPTEYAENADRVEGELGLPAASIPPERLGAIDTFRFEERAVLGHGAALVAQGKFAEALVFVEQREQNFWLDHDVSRRAQWEACRLMAVLGSVAADVLAQVRGATGDAAELVNRYTAPDGWLRLDQAQRRLETFVSKLDDDPPDRALAAVRRGYEDACQAMAEGFTRALVQAGWVVPGALHQTSVYADIVARQPTPVAYFLVDSMRFEMGAELAGRLPKAAEVRIRPAVAALPSITPVGMAALQPGASRSFDIVANGAKLGARIDGTFLPDLAGRRKFAAAHIPNLADLTLGDVLTWSKTKLAAQIAGALIVIVRSQEIDLAGEGGFAHEARHAMDSVIDDLVRGVRRLAEVGVEQAVLTADHGHLFMHDDLDESMRIDAPGGTTVKLERRCWIGHGGATPPGCVRVSGPDLGYASDLEFVFPRGAGVFKAGGDLAYHHGGLSLQEMIIPVVTVRSAPMGQIAAAAEPVSVANLPYRITNRIFSVTMELGGKNLALFSTPTSVQPLLLSGARQVGSVGMAMDAEFNAGEGTVTLQPGNSATVAFLLSDDTAETIRIVVRDPATDRELYRSPEIPVQLGVG